MPYPSPLPAATVVARLSTDGTRAQQIGDLLAESFDADEVAASAFEQPDGRWSLALHFRGHPDETAVRALIASTAGRAAADALVFETLAPTDWVHKSLEGLTPVEAGRFVVHGAHHRASVRANQIGIQIEAALAFGTGHHGTTEGCLVLLEEALAAGPGAAVLDIGTGTGILAIAALKLGAPTVLAIDVDPDAVSAAQVNGGRNGCAGLSVRLAEPQEIPDRFPVVLANLLTHTHLALVPQYARLVAPGGSLVLGGMLQDEDARVSDALAGAGFTTRSRLALEGWASLRLEARAS